MSTETDVRREFDRLGLSISEWARERGYSAALVYQILSGTRKGIRGQSHQIAVSLGLKEGDIGDIKDLRLPKRNKD